MKKHVKTYMRHHGYAEQDFIPCEVCGAQAVDVHHIDPKGMGGSKERDGIGNLIGLCRVCHIKAHANEITKEELKAFKSCLTQT